MLQIAHRLESVMSCHKVVVIDEGHIIEEGDPGVLMNSGGAFAAMYAAQSGDSRE